MTTLELKNKFLELSSSAENLTAEFLNMSYTQINWKPADSQWSIGECFEHLIRTNMKYIPTYELNKPKDEEDYELEFKPTFLGNFIVKSVKPDNKRKFKTSASFNPIGSSIKENIVEDFINQNREIAALVRMIDSNKMSLKISSPFSKLVRYSIGDSLLVIGNHNLRHIQQAKRVMQNKNFPAV